MLFSIMAVLICIPTASVPESPFLYIPVSICYFFVFLMTAILTRFPAISSQICRPLLCSTGKQGGSVRFLNSLLCTHKAVFPDMASVSCCPSVRGERLGTASDPTTALCRGLHMSAFDERDLLCISTRREITAYDRFTLRAPLSAPPGLE